MQEVEWVERTNILSFAKTPTLRLSVVFATDDQAFWSVERRPYAGETIDRHGVAPTVELAKQAAEEVAATYAGEDALRVLKQQAIQLVKTIDAIDGLSDRPALAELFTHEIAATERSLTEMMADAVD